MPVLAICPDVDAINPVLDVPRPVTTRSSLVNIAFKLMYSAISEDTRSRFHPTLKLQGYYRYFLAAGTYIRRGIRNALTAGRSKVSQKPNKTLAAGIWDREVRCGAKSSKSACIHGHGTYLPAEDYPLCVARRLATYMLNSKLAGCRSFANWETVQLACKVRLNAGFGQSCALETKYLVYLRAWDKKCILLYYTYSLRICNFNAFNS